MQSVWRGCGRGGSCVDLRMPRHRSPFEAKCEMGFKSLLPQAVTLLMAASESHERGSLIGLAQMLQISQVIIMALAL